jgi:hypothetical protein
LLLHNGTILDGAVKAIVEEAEFYIIQNLFNILTKMLRSLIVTVQRARLGGMPAHMGVKTMSTTRRERRFLTGAVLLSE